MKYCVYFYYGPQDELLYIGKSKDIYKRWLSHQEDWKKDVLKIGVREYPDEAAMDIFERYYVSKIKTVYNVGFLEHGYTSVEINDFSELNIYTLDEFKRKYGSSGKTSKVTIRYSFEEKIKLAGNIIVELSSSKIDLFDENILKYDLDRVCFKYNDLYFYSKILKKKGDYIPKNEHLYIKRTNNTLLSLKSLLESVDNFRSNEKNKCEFTLRVANKEEATKNVNPLVETSCLFVISKINKNGNGKEKGSKYLSCPVLLDTMSCSFGSNNVCKYKFESQFDLFDESSYIYLSSEHFQYNLSHWEYLMMR